MNHVYSYTLKTAFEARDKGQLFQWAQDYLRGEGWNKGLADNLLEGKPTIIELIDFPLNKLKRIMGPEVHMNYIEELDIWEERINNLTKAIKNGAKFPPLIVTDLWKDLEIADGSHRYEALIRSGYEKYWTIFFFNKEDSKRVIRLD